jgi:hypothetical protein
VQDPLGHYIRQDPELGGLQGVEEPAEPGLPDRIREPLAIPERPNHTKSVDCMADALWFGQRFPDLRHQRRLQP